MRSETVTLTGDSAGTQRSLTCFRFGQPGAAPKVYLQAGLHADEMPGILILQHLLPLLESLATNQIRGEIIVVPMANPIGLSQWLQHKPLGRQDTESMQNFNRNYPDLAALVGDDLEPLLTDDPAENQTIIRTAFAHALAASDAKTDLDEQRLTLLKWSYDADYVLDLHCDHHAILHLYAAPARPADTSLLCQSIGARLALIEEISGGNAFDEAHTAPWASLKRRYQNRFPIPDACFSTTLEYRGQFDVDDATAATDAANLMTFLGAIHAINPPQTPNFPDPPHLPLGGAIETFAPQGGVVTWATKPGDSVTMGQTLGHVTDPVTRLRKPITAPTDGLLFRQELWPSCLRGQGLAHVAGSEVLLAGHLLSD
ncbi:MAG: succinylglutamate desuccinylase/aspartoacylase family protein [Paracoccaceae bacterium]